MLPAQGWVLTLDELEIHQSVAYSSSPWPMEGRFSFGYITTPYRDLNPVIVTQQIIFLDAFEPEAESSRWTVTGAGR